MTIRVTGNFELRGQGSQLFITVNSQENPPKEERVTIDPDGTLIITDGPRLPDGKSLLVLAKDHWSAVVDVEFDTQNPSSALIKARIVD